MELSLLSDFQCLPSSLYPPSFCNFVSVLCPATLLERSMGLSTKVVMTVFCLEGWRGGGWPARAQGWKRGAGRKFAVRTGLPGRLPWQLIQVLGCPLWAYSKSQHLLSTWCVPGPVCALSPLILTQPREGGTIISVLKMRAKA